MSSDEEIRPRRPNSLERARLVSQEIANAARRARFSARSRHRLTQGGFEDRAGQVLFRWAAILSFWLMVIIPSVSVAIYYAFIASDKYEVTLKVTVSGVEPPESDGIGAMTGMPSASIVQDTQIVVNHLTTRAAVEQLDRKIGLREMYARKEIDSFSRFDRDKPIEKFVRYWKNMVEPSISMPSGIIEVHVRAFTPADTLKLGNAVVEISEALINELNERMFRDAVAQAEVEVERGMQRLARAREALQKERDRSGLLDVSKAAEGLGVLLTETRGALLLLQQEYATQLRVVSSSAPQMQALRARINATAAQITELEAKITSTGGGVAGDPALSKLLTRFSELDLEREIAEKLYASAIASLEVARMTAERKTMYINTFVHPALPEEPRYPRRMMWSMLFAACALTLWALLASLVGFIRNHMG